MAGHTLIDTHLATLAQRLPARIVDELADGLVETYQHHRERGANPAEAANAAIAEFGEPDEIITAFTRQAPGRRAALELLATAPMFAVCWGASLIAGQAWTWPVPTAATVAFGLVLAGVVATLGAAVTTQNYRRTRLAAAGMGALLVLDSAMLAAVLLAAPTLVWPMALAVPASLARIGLSLYRLPQVLQRW